MPIKPAFSAIELLIVAGITAILVAIAVPGYLDAKVRAEVVDVRVSLNQISNALLQYHLEQSDFPESPTYDNPKPLNRLIKTELLTQEPTDRFKQGLSGLGGLYSNSVLGYDYVNPTDNRFVFFHASNMAKSSGSSAYRTKKYWFMHSIGPDQTDYRDEGLGRLSGVGNELGIVEYDPTNGTFSLGEITRTQIGG
ncbi:MAG: hypothetical protein P9L94_00190 [Candidatus Hinthialibacter antarcticus]|nr:hypothetical protein [Candidatus Hinthialibacter antarcticus]